MRRPRSEVPAAAVLPALDDESVKEHREESSPPTLEDIQRRLNNGVTLVFGGPIEHQERQALRRELAELRDLLAQQPPQHGRMGHNQPPEHLSLTIELRLEAIESIDRMAAELAKDTPDVAVVVESAGRLRKIWSWVCKKLDKSVDNFVGAVGTTIGVTVAAELAGIPVSEKIGKVLNMTVEWLNTVTLPF
jgi:hypothetical protein